MTYSNNIDANNPLCQFEAAGGTCNDDQCQGQHFRAMSLSGALLKREKATLMTFLFRLEANTNLLIALDDMILVRLGTQNPGRTPAEEKQWVEGLKTLLKDLRQRNTRNLNDVATEIADYRRKFLNDPTRILVL